MTLIERWHGHIDANGHQILRQRVENVEILPAEGLEGQIIYCSTNNQGYLWESAAWRRISALTEMVGLDGNPCLTLFIDTGSSYQIRVGLSLMTSQAQLVHSAGFGIGCDPQRTLDTIGMDWRRRSYFGETPLRTHASLAYGGKAFSAGTPFLLISPPVGISPFFAYLTVTVTERADPSAFCHAVSTVVVTELGTSILHTMSATYRAISMTALNTLSWVDTTPLIPAQAPRLAALSADSFVVIEQHALVGEALVEFL